MLTSALFYLGAIMQFVNYAIRVRETFLARKDFDQLYFPGDQREVVTFFSQPENDDTLAKQRVIDLAAKEDIVAEVLEVSKEVIEVPDPPSSPKLIMTTEQLKELGYGV